MGMSDTLDKQAGEALLKMQSSNRLSGRLSGNYVDVPGQDGRMIPGIKRPRTSKACNQCRKQKTRCEVDPTTSQKGDEAEVLCHRCKVLSMPCSFLTLPPNVTPKVAPKSRASNRRKSPNTPLTPRSQHRTSESGLSLDDRCTTEPRDMSDLSLIHALDSTPEPFTRFLNERSSSLHTEDPKKAPIPLDIWGTPAPLISSLLHRTEGESEGKIDDERKAEIDTLWTKLYQPFLGYPLTSSSNTLLLSIRHLLVSKHIHLTPLEVSDLEKKVMTQIVNHIISGASIDVSIIQAFHILSKWMPNSFSTNHAFGHRTYFLNQAIQAMKDLRLVFSPDHKRLWFSLCLSVAWNDISNANLPRMEGLADLEQTLPPLDQASPSDARMIFQFQLLQLTCSSWQQIAAYKSSLFSVQEIRFFLDSTTASLTAFDNWMRVFLRISALAEEKEAPFFTAIKCASHFCKTLICFHAVMRLRIMVPNQLIVPDHQEVAGVFRQGVNAFASRVCGSLEEIIVLILSNNLDIDHLMSSTDLLVLVVIYSAALLIKIHVVTVSGWRRCLDFAEDTYKLLTKLLDKMNLCKSDILSRMQGLVKSLMKVWQERAATVLHGQGHGRLKEDQISSCLSREIRPEVSSSPLETSPHSEINPASMLTSTSTSNGDSLPTPKEHEHDGRNIDIMPCFDVSVMMSSHGATPDASMWNNLSAVLDDDLFNLFSFGSSSFNPEQNTQVLS